MKSRTCLVHYVARVVAFIVVAPLAWWAMDRDPPIIVHGYSIAKDPVVRGDNLVVTYDLTYRRRCSGDAQRFFVDATGALTPINPFKIKDGIRADGKPALINERDRDAVSMAPVPIGMSAGRALYQNATTFYCNPLQRLVPQLGISFHYPVVSFGVSTAPALVDVKTPRSIWEAFPDGTARPQDALPGIVPPLPGDPTKRKPDR